jgi:tetratricopeptide (TPR) repeat protein
MGRTLPICLGLVVATVAVFGQTLGFEFVLFDDDGYVVDNPWLRRGLGADSLRWAWTTGSMSNWHPLTWLSYLVDFELYGPSPAGFHATNLLLHIVATLLLFGALRLATGREGRSALVAALFALHPLHVESVAWVSERKDVLSACLGFGSLWAYLAYGRRGGWARYALSAALLALGLAAKPMLVTLPALFLLLDHWPLDRLRRGGARVLVEKLPLLALSAAASVLTLRAQGGMLGAGAELTLPLRLANAVHATTWYLAKTLWPTGLAAHYPHPYLPWAGGEPLETWRIAVAGLTLLALSAAALRARRQPYLLVGWLWFLGTLAPVSGLLQVGTQAMADRYTYLPLVGIFLAGVWGGAELLHRLAPERRTRQRVAAGLAAGLLGVFGGMAFVQAGTWRDSVTLFEHALRVAPRDRLLHTSLGMGYQARGLHGRAIPCFERALAIDPDDPLSHFRRAVSHTETGEHDLALRHYHHALRLTPRVPELHENLAGLHLLRGDPELAARHYRRATELRPESTRLHASLGLALHRSGSLDASIASYRRALELDPGHLAARLNLARAFGALGRFDDAIRHFERVLERSPEHRDAHAGRSLAQRMKRGVQDPG